MNRRKFIAGVTVLGAALMAPQAEAASNKCYCGRSEFKRFEFGTNGIVACTSCGLMFVQSLKRKDP